VRGGHHCELVRVLHHDQIRRQHRQTLLPLFSLSQPLHGLGRHTPVKTLCPVHEQLCAALFFLAADVVRAVTVGGVVQPDRGNDGLRRVHGVDKQVTYSVPVITQRQVQTRPAQIDLVPICQRLEQGDLVLEGDLET